MRPRIQWERRSMAILVVVSSLLGALAAGATAHASAVPSFGSTRGGVQIPIGPVSCSDLVSDATLTSLISQYYPNASLLPTENQAGQAVSNLWNSLCNSTAFHQTIESAQGGWFAYISSMQNKTRNASGDLVGFLYVDFEVTWNGSCPAGGPGYPAGYGCQTEEEWQANLSAQSVSPPDITTTSLRFVVCDAPDANLTAVSSVEGFFPDPGTAPNESVAVEEVQTIWGEICSSTAYYTIAAPLDVPQVLSFSTWRSSTGPNATLGTAGHLYFEWSLWVGDVPCPSANGTGSNGGQCSHDESWTADLSQDTYLGPTSEYYPNLGGTTESPQGAANGSSAQWVPTALGFAGLGGVVVVAMLIGIADRRRS